VLCFGGNDGFAHVTATGGVPPYTYIWDNGAVTESTSVLYAGYHTVTVTDANGCIYSISTNISEPPSLSLSMPLSYDVCHGQYQDVICSVTGGTPPYTYYWNGQQGDSILTIHPEYDYDITVVVVDAHGCSDSLTTHIFVSTPLDITLISNRDSVCPGDPVMFAASFTGGSGEPYTIVLDGDTIPSLPHIMNIWQSHYVVLDVKDKCGSEDKDSLFIYVYPIPNLQIFSDTLRGCLPLTVNFNVINDTMNCGTYIWNFGDNENLSTASHPAHTYTRSGIFDVWVQCTTIQGCKAGDTVPEMIEVFPKPEAEYVINPRVVNVLQPEVQFINQSEGNVLNLWNFGDGDSSLFESPIHRYPQIPAHYISQLIIENDYGCRDTAVKDIYIEDIHTFWAPTAFSPDGDGQNDFFFVRGFGIDKKDFVLYIYDRWGELVSTITDFNPVTHSSGKWDGSIKGHKKGANGVYKWVCKFKDVFGKDHTETGNVLLIR
jgi:gliding motility-associated-like protein